MSVEVKGSWQEWEPKPEWVGKDEGELFVRVFLPYSDLHWASQSKVTKDFDAIPKREIPQGMFETDEDYYAKDEDGNLLPGNITEDIYWAVHHTLPFWRLASIRQLALLTHSTEDEINYYIKGPGFNQTRDNHSFLTARSLEKMLIINNCSKATINNGIIAGMIHDIATPPYGDPTKEIDPEVLDEEVAVQRVLDKFDLSALGRFNFDKQTVLDAIAGKGKLGKMLDIADKIAYTSVDTFHFVGDVLEDFARYDAFLNPEPTDPQALERTIKPIKELLTNDDKWANIYRDVRLGGSDEPFFTDAHRLSTFLELRARIHKGLYLNPHCRAQDMLYKMLIKPLYSRDPEEGYPLNSENLLFLTDWEADQIITRAWKSLNLKTVFDSDRDLHRVLRVLPDYAKVKNPRDVNRKIRALQSHGKLVIGSETIRRFNPATNFRARDLKDGKVKTFAEIFPEKTAELHAMVDHCNQTVVYYWPDSTNPETPEFKLRPTISQIVEDAKRRNKGKLPNYSLY